MKHYRYILILAMAFLMAVSPAACTFCMAANSPARFAEFLYRWHGLDQPQPADRSPWRDTAA